ncbi:MAG: S8 family serine peptidase [Tildeniella nuda ZEHNDER 1965/U140]|nr:S8 family serine peptidase [Tildeniella nuda ZEHNDER 1965/U140]
MNKRFLAYTLLCISVCLAIVLGSWFLGNPTIAQEKLASELVVVPGSYRYKGQQIPLVLRTNEVAVAFKQPGAVRELNQQPLYRQLQNDLQSGSRDLDASINVSPVGTGYAIVKLPSSRGLESGLLQRIEARPYVQETLPVLSRTGQQEKVILPNEIIVSFAPGITDVEKQTILKDQNLELIRPLPFTQNRSLVKAQSAKGTAILTVANRLNQVKGITSATPNFLQILPGRSAFLTPTRTPTASNPSLTSPTTSRSLTPYTSDLLPLQWHLDSRSRRPNQPRTDVHALEAWQQSTAGKGVVVAVLDNLIQWDHPNLANSLYQPEKLPNQLPGEVSGWDFVQNDPDTRLSQAELANLLPDFQRAFQLSDSEILSSDAAKALKKDYPKASDSAIANEIRSQLREEAIVSFHGTMTAGMIAARPADGKGVIGVAPNAKILPVRVGGLGSSVDLKATIQGIGYAAERRADVMNMSFGGLLPSDERDDEILRALQANPNLVVVVASGNEQLERAGFPAAVKGTIAVGATNLAGNRASYSNFGTGLDVVAPGGDNLSRQPNEGVLTTTGIGMGGFWQRVEIPKTAWDLMQDPKGDYVWTQGTSFAAPAVAGVIALMKGEDPQHKLNRDRLTAILKATVSKGGLKVSDGDQKLFQRLRSKTKLSLPTDPKLYFFGSGLVNAEAAVQEVKRSVK